MLAQRGESPDEILTHYPHITLSDVYAALAYYYDNRQAVDQQATEDEAFVDDLRKELGPGPLEKKLVDDSTSSKS